MKHDTMALVVGIILILSGIVYLQHLEITALIDKAGAQGVYAKAIDAVSEEIDHIYLETRPREDK